ncbi:MAG: flagellar protein, partial [Bradyrhizobium sp.]|nr:flagellar protein [Bradyrhizobium sp.]
MRLIAAIVVLTLIAIGAGALAGLHLFAAAERV